MASSGFKVQFTRHQIDHDHEIVQGAIAPRLGLGRLDQAVDTFQQAVRHPRLKPAQDAVLVLPNRPRHVNERRQPAVGGPEIPPLQVRAGPFGRLVVEVLETFPEPQRPRRFQVQPSVLQVGQPGPLPNGQVPPVFQPQVARPLQFRPLALLRPPDLVHRLVEQPGHVKFVEGDPGRGQMLPHPRLKGRRHVDADFRHLGRRSAMGGQILGEARHRVAIFAGRHMHHFRPVQIHEHADVVVTPPAGRLVDAHPAHSGQVGLRPRRAHVVVDDPPQPRVVLAHDPAGRPHRHLPHQRHHQRFEQQREAAARPRPRHRHRLHPALGALRPRHPGMQVRLMLEEVQMPPGPLLGVVRRAACLPAVRTGEAPALGEVDIQVQPLLAHAELAVLHQPGRQQPERQLKQIRVSHDGSLRGFWVSGVIVAGAVELWESRSPRRDFHISTAHLAALS